MSVFGTASFPRKEHITWAFLFQLTAVTPNSGCRALQAESNVPSYVEQALAGSDPKLIL